MAKATDRRTVCPRCSARAVGSLSIVDGPEGHPVLACTICGWGAPLHGALGAAVSTALWEALREAVGREP